MLLSPEQPLTRLAVALAIGLVIGLERGWSARDEREGERDGRVRQIGAANVEQPGDGVGVAENERAGAAERSAHARADFVEPQIAVTCTPSRFNASM